MCLTNFFKNPYETLEVVRVAVHCLLNVTNKRLRLLFRVDLTITFRSLSARYEFLVQSGWEESSSVDTVNQVTEGAFYSLRISNVNSRASTGHHEGRDLGVFTFLQ